MKIYILFWSIGILNSDVLSLRPTTPMRPPEETQAAKVAQMINFVNTLKKRVSFLGYDKRRTELAHVEEIKPWIANLYKVLLSKEEQTSREYTQKLANMARYYIINNPEVLDEFGKKKIKRKKDIRRPSYESAASSDPVSESQTSSLEPRYKGLGPKSLKRRYDMEFLPDPEANPKEFNIGKKEDEFGQLVLKNSEEKDVIFQPVGENGPKFEPDLDFNINEKENVRPKSIFGEILDNVKSSEIEITTESAPTTDYNKDQNVVKGKYIKAEEEEIKNDHHKRKPLEPKTDDGDYDRGTYQNHRPDEMSPKKEGNETKTDLNYRVEKIKETELNNYLKGYGQQKRFKEEQRLKSVEVNNEQKNNGAQYVTIDPHRTDQHKDVDNNETIDPHKHKDLNKNQQNDEKTGSKERKPQTNQWDLKGKENEYKYEGNEKIKDQNNDDHKRNLNENEDKFNKNNKPRLDNENNGNKDNNNQKHDNENQDNIEWTRDDDRNIKDRDNVMKDHHEDRNQRNLEQSHNDYDRLNDEQRYDDRDQKNNDEGRYDDWSTKRNDRDRKHNDWDNKESNMNKNNDWGSNNNDRKNNNNNKKNDWATNNDNYGKKNERNEKNIDWDTKNYDGDNKKDDSNIKQDWNTKKDAWNEKQSWNTKKGNWNTEKDDWNTNKYNADNNNNQNYNRYDSDRNNNGDKRHDIDNTNYWDRNDKTKRKDNWDDDADWKKDNKKNRKKHSMEKKEEWKEYSVDNKKKVTDEPKNNWDTVGTKQKKPKGGGHKKKKVLKQGPVEVFKPIEKDWNIDAEPVKQKTPSSWDDYVPKNNDNDDYKPIKKKKRGSYERSKNSQPNHSAFGRTPIPFAGKKRIYADK